MSRLFRALSIYALTGVLFTVSADVLIDDFTAGDTYLGFTFYGTPVPVGMTGSDDVFDAGILGGNRHTTFHKIAGSDYSPYVGQSTWQGGTLTFNSAFNNQAEWSLHYGYQNDLDLDLTTGCDSDRLVLNFYGQLDTDCNGSGPDGTPISVTLVSNGVADTESGMLHCSPTYFDGDSHVQAVFMLADFDGVDPSDVDEIIIELVQNANNAAVDYGVGAMNFNCQRTSDTQDLPVGYELAQNHPNPFNPTTTIAFSLAETSEARLTVFDLQGSQVAVLVDGLQPAGESEVVFDASNLASGVYVYMLETPAGSLSRKMLLVK